MSVITEVMKRTGATRADIIRVATRGGDTRADWRIAHAIEAAGGKKAAELMLTAGRDQMIAQIWGDAGAPTPTPTNPLAKHDPTVRIYDEPTAPDAPNTVLADHPHEVDDEPVDEIDDQDQDETDPGRAAWNALLHTHVWADVAALTGGAPGEIARTVRPWATATDAIAGMTALIARRRAARTPGTNTIAAALAA
ncbi:hypothetical protein BJF83_20630 [Nocardiopsis sp. CNR-923]|uniref:hypothetical protein n=1 Tax=Nocardiopsis sp. CNR-923 TaxID=1904965 RepID=UPI00095F7F1C|nr:hypothetical protein [Nocardiopsis sp. CNR-923]OLT26572.1 hypothetical protein BJF83_20630 [Nocardiopsis sp. CNR-923]